MLKIKKKKLIFKNQVYRVFSNEIRSKSLRVKDYLTLEVKGKKYGGVCCIIIHKNKIGLMKTYSPIVRKFFFSLPQGFTNYNENIKHAIKREVLEETGIKLEKKELIKICEIYPIQSLIKSKLAVFYSKTKFHKKLKKEEISEEIGTGKLFFFTFQEIKKMLKKTNNFDLITFSALSYFLFLM
jgi:8-oxo-dGTP pyrophosphatase MutT (NUDIX family)